MEAPIYADFVAAVRLPRLELEINRSVLNTLKYHLCPEFDHSIRR